MKKVLSLVLILVLSVSLAACGGKSEQLARETADNFMTALIQLDLAEVENYIDDASGLPETFKNFDVDQIMSTLPADLNDYSEEFRGIITNLMDKVKGTMAYEIKSVEKVEGDYVFTLDLTMPVNDIDFESLIEDKVSDEAINKIVTDMVASGEITAASSQKEMMDALMGKFIEIINNTFNELEIKTETQEAQLFVSKIDDKWLVNAEKSEFK